MAKYASTNVNKRVGNIGVIHNNNSTENFYGVKILNRSKLRRIKTQSFGKVKYVSKFQTK